MKEVKVKCPKCGTKFGVGLTELPVKQRIEALKAAGVDTSNLFALELASGEEVLCSRKEDGTFSTIGDNDPIYEAIMNGGTIPNRSLFRRWVMAQMFRMMTATTQTNRGSKRLIGVTESIHRLGYEYQWKMILNEFHAQVKMLQNNDMPHLSERNRWFNKEVAVSLCEDYIVKLEKWISELRVRKCKGIPYVTINHQHIFVSDIPKKIIDPLRRAMWNVEGSKNVIELEKALCNFDKLRRKLPWQTKQCGAWLDAYKGAGAFYTAQNLIRFHGCTIVDDYGVRLPKESSLAYLESKASQYDKEGWRLLGLLKQLLRDNNVDLIAKRAEWANKKKAFHTPVTPEPTKKVKTKKTTVKKTVSKK